MLKNVIIIEGTDNCGKDTLIMKLLEKFPISTIIHCSKPKSDDNEEQDNLFKNYALDISDYIYDNSDVVIFNRSHIGEYVYGCLYRNRNEDEVLDMINTVDSLLTYRDDYKIKYIQLLCTSNKLLADNEDGKSLSGGKLDRINNEILKFQEIYRKSQLDKHLVYVNDDDNFRSREDIFNEVWNFIES